MNFTETAAYRQLEKHRAFLSDARIIDLFDENPARFEEFSESLGDIIFDFSKNLLDLKALDLFVKMAGQVGLPDRIDGMFAGKRINFTEERAALHVALRSGMLPEVRETYVRMAEFADKVRKGVVRGSNGSRILDIVNVGIGGSHLGPKMAVEALRPYKDPLLNFHFVANVDAADLEGALLRCSPESTLFIISSKTFTTDETMTNAASARDWLVSRLGSAAVESHFCAISANVKACAAFGIPSARVFPFGDYVGGRYSMWGPIGLSILMSIGPGNFEALLAGARAADEHFRHAELRHNIPALMAFVSVWNTNFLDCGGLAVLPYGHALRYLPGYLQQLVMESNGKGVDSRGRPVPYHTSPILFGEEGTNGQHSFYQLLHQGTRKISCDFIIPILSRHELGSHHAKLVANGIAQSEALMRGKSMEEVLSEKITAGIAPFKVFPGNRPSNVFLVREITPETLGSLVALYEHKTFVEGVLWDINSFDQMGVELGKSLAKTVLEDMENPGAIANHDSSTAHLIALAKGIRAPAE
jgi:glucose-6-phosphate isomerase